MEKISHPWKYEYRSFWSSKKEALDSLLFDQQSMRQQLEEVDNQKDKSDYYIHSAGTNINIKIRDSVLHIKTLVDIDNAEGIYCYVPKIKIKLPFSSMVLAPFFRHIKTPKKLKTPKEILDFLQEHGYSTQLITVKKKRKKFLVPNQKDISTEFARIKLGDDIFYTLCAESKDFCSLRNYCGKILNSDANNFKDVNIMNYYQMLDRFCNIDGQNR